ncbi:MAG: response regulator, partial [Dehalococcoidia bacterium]
SLRSSTPSLTRFFVGLPSVDATIAAEPVLAVTVRDTRPTILVVDDNPQIRSFLRPALEDAGFACLEAADGAEAVYHAEASRPDLIVLDIELGDPVMDGLDVCRQIRALDLDMPVIFLTVRATVQDMESGLRVAGPGSDYVRKLEELRRLQLGGASPSRDRLRNPEGHRAPTGHPQGTRRPL